MALTGTAILLVDDDADVVEILNYVLAEEGATVRTATKAREALMILRIWRPDVMLLDISMPEIDGYELLTRIRREPALHEVPAVAVTGYATERERNRSMAAGFSRHVTKPFEVPTLVHLITTLAPSPLRSHGGAASGDQDSRVAEGCLSIRQP
jgi:CheY-like chemotaxis protein